MMDMEKLAELERVCGALLRAHAYPEIVANPYLHPLNAHPSALERYRDLDAEAPSLRRRVRNLIAGAVVPLQGLGSQAVFRGDALPSQADVVFVSHLLRPSQARDDHDLYFGGAPGELDKRDMPTVTALINHTGQSWRRLGAHWHQGASRRIVLARRLGLPAERAIGRRLALAGQQFRNQKLGGESVFARAVRNHAAADAASTSSRTALRIGLQVEDLVRRLRAKMIVTTFEGHGWERLAFWHARKARPDILCVGYHHALLFPHTMAMTQRLGGGYDPDVILTAGPNTKVWLRAQKQLAGTPIETLGSVRVPAMSGSLRERAASRTCLIIPEGSISESRKLIMMAAELARRAPELTFRIRLHPLLQRERLQRDPGLKALPSNMVWSHGSLEDDLGQSRWVLYRGSTAVIAAALAGLRPIYFNDGGIVIDPLDALETWRVRVSGSSDLARAIATDLTEPDESREAGFAVASVYCRQCFTSFDLQVLQSLIPGQNS